MYHPRRDQWAIHARPSALLGFIVNRFYRRICFTMATDTRTRLESLLEQGRAAADVGNSTVARTCFRRATEIAPECAPAWLGLAAVTAVLAERRDYLLRASALDDAAARKLLDETDAMIAAGRLIAVPERAPAEPAPPSLSALITHPPALARVGVASLLVAATVSLLTMVTLTMVGALIFTSLLGYFLAFVVGPLVGDLMQRLGDQLTRARRGRIMQAAFGTAVAVGGMAALILGGTLLPAIGLPIPSEAIAMARSMGAQSAATVLLFHPAMLVFVGSAVAGTVYRFK